MEQRKLHFLIFILFLANLSHSQNLDSFIDSIYNNSECSQHINAINHPENSQKAQALFYYYMGRYHHRFTDSEKYFRYLSDMQRGRLLSLQHHLNDIEQTRFYYKKALSCIKNVVEQEPCAENIAINAEIMSHYSLLENFKQMVNYGLKVEPMAKKALEMDPHNIRARMILASAKVFSPKIYGGDPEDGEEAFRAILNDSDQLTNEQLFNCYTGIAYSLILRDMKSDSKKWIRKAEKIYPSNPLLSVLKNWK